VRIEYGRGGRHKLLLLKGIRAEQVLAYLNRKGW
jgi:hypothetical protein